MKKKIQYDFLAFKVLFHIVKFIDCHQQRSKIYILQTAADIEIHISSLAHFSFHKTENLQINKTNSKRLILILAFASLEAIDAYHLIFMCKISFWNFVFRRLTHLQKGFCIQMIPFVCVSVVC